MKWMLQYPELKDLDVMILDCDMDFAEVQSIFHPRTLIRTHDYKVEQQPAPAIVYTDYPDGKFVLTHGQSWLLWE